MAPVRSKLGRASWEIFAAIGVSASLLGCSASDAPRDAGAERGDAYPDASRDAIGTDSAACSAPTPQAPPVDSGACTAASVSIDPASLCSGAVNCPIGAFYRLTGGAVSPAPTLAAIGDSGAAVLASAGGTQPACLFTMATGVPAQGQELPSAGQGVLAEQDGLPTSVLAAVAGAPLILTSQASGLGYLQEMASGWVGGAVPQLSGPISPTATSGLPSGDLYALFADIQNLPYAETFGLASRHAGCWQIANLPATVGPSVDAGTPLDAGVDAGTLTSASITFTSIGVDAAQRPWIVGFYSTITAAGLIGLEIVGPDGRDYQVETSLIYGTPIVIGGGLSGTAAYPTVVVQSTDGLHLFEAEGSAAAWTDLTIPIPTTTPSVNSDDCPHTEFTEPPAGCASITSCGHAFDGTNPGFAAARTASGKTLVAWPKTNGGLTSYSLGCGQFAPNVCSCTLSAVASSQGSGTILITRADTTPPTQVLQISFPTAFEVDNYDMTMTSRGDTLLLTANEHFVAGTRASNEILYFEIDTTGF